MEDNQSAESLSRKAFAMGHKPAERLKADPFWGENLPAELLSPDDRWQNYIVGTREDLERIAREWLVDPNVPEDISRMLRVSRQLFSHSYFVHEFAVAAVTWALFAVEGSIRLALGLSSDDREGLHGLVGKAQGRGWLSSELGDRLRAAGRLRNMLVHTEAQRAFTLGVSVPIMETVHEGVSFIWQRRGRIEGA